MTTPTIYPYLDGDAIIQLVPLAQYQADITELNERLTKQHADMLTERRAEKRNSTQLIRRLYRAITDMLDTITELRAMIERFLESFEAYEVKAGKQHAQA